MPQHSPYSNEVLNQVLMLSKIEFYDYVLDFYGPGGIYDMNATLDQVMEATEKHIQTSKFPFDGDTIDRECVREIMINDYGLKWPDFTVAHPIAN